MVHIWTPHVGWRQTEKVQVYEGWCIYMCDSSYGIGMTILSRSRRDTQDVCQLLFMQAGGSITTWSFKVDLEKSRYLQIVAIIIYGCFFSLWKIRDIRVLFSKCEDVKLIFWITVKAMFCLCIKERRWGLWICYTQFLEGWVWRPTVDIPTHGWLPLFNHPLH